MPKAYETIYLIDDDDINNLLNRQFIAFTLPDTAVTTFQEAPKAIDSLRDSESAKPDLILLDINMPEMDGWEFLQILDDQKLDADVMVLSSSLHDRDMERARQFGRVKCYIEKPLTEDKIEHFIRDRKYQSIGVD